MKNTDEIFSNISRKPFSIRKFITEHQIGILGTLAFHMILLILFLGMKIQDYKETSSLDVIFEFEEELSPEEQARLEEEQERAEYYERLLEQQLNAGNRAVNESKLEEELSTEKYVEDLLKELESQKSEDEKLTEEILDEYLNQEDIVLVNEELPEDKQNKEFRGPTNISYVFLEAPLKRVSVNLPPPVYKCRGFGVVEVSVSVNRTGNVVSAKGKVIEASEDPECLSSVAEKYALQSLFRGDAGAPADHKAVITYRFVAQ